MCHPGLRQGCGPISRLNLLPLERSRPRHKLRSRPDVLGGKVPSTNLGKRENGVMWGGVAGGSVEREAEGWEWRVRWLG